MRAVLLVLLLVGCAAPIRDVCATGVDTWVSGGYGDAQGRSQTTGLIGETRDAAESWDMSVGVSVHWDLTGSCWEYSEPEEEENLPPGTKPGDPQL